LVVRLKDSEAKLASTRDGAMEEYRVEIQKLRSQLKAKDSQRVAKLEGDLREAEMRLNELENEKAAMAEEYMERIGQLELDKKDGEEELQKLKDEKSTQAVKHLATVQNLEEDKHQVEAEFESSIKSREGEIAQLKMSMDQICAEKEDIWKQLKKLEEDKEAVIRHHKKSLEEFQYEKKKTEEDLMSQLQAKESEISDLMVTTLMSSAGEPTSDSDQIAMLKQEIEKLQKQLLEEQVVNQQREPMAYGNFEYQSRGALESDLLKQLETAQREREQESRTLKEKLEDRDTTISALVKSSVVLEKKISELSGELENLRQDQETAVQSIQARSASDVEDAQDEVKELREALEDYKEVELRLVHELSQSKKQLKFAEAEISRLQEVMDDDGSCDSHHYRRQIQERDDAVSALVQQSMTHESKMQELQKRLQSATQELEAMREERKRSSVQLKAELRRLHQESEIFAGQIIEQDEELEALRAEIHNRDERIVALNRIVSAAGTPTYRPSMMTPNGESPEVVRLMAQIDELEEANETYRIDMRDARLKLRDFDGTRNELARVKCELDELHRKLQATAGSHGDRRAAAGALEEAERKVEELAAAKEATSHACEMLARERDALVAQRDKVIEGLRRNIDGCTSQIEALETEIDTVHAELKEKVQLLEAEKQRVAKLEGQIRSMTNDNVETRHIALFEEIEELQQQVRDLEVENTKLSSFKHKMDEVEQLQAQSNQMAESYERKMSSLVSDRDKTIDSLQKSLFEIKGQAADDFEAMSRDMRKLDLENQTLRQEMRIALEQKNNQIFALEHTLDAQEHLVGSMKNEMDHLQGSMHNTVSSRREEFEDMEREVLDLTTRNTAFEREITSLKMQLEESKLVHMAEVAKLKETVDSLEYQAAPSQVMRQKNPIEDFPIGEIQERLQKLKWRNNSIQEENFKLKSRLEKAEAEIQSSRNEKYRTANLEAKVGALMKQLEKVEKENQTAKAVAQNASLPPAGKETPPQSPQRTSSRPPSRPTSRSGSRAGTPLRSAAQLQETQAGSRPGSSQGTPQRKRTPLQPRMQAQAPETPSRMRGIFSFGKKKDHDNMSVASMPARPQYLVPPNSSAPQSEKFMKAPISDRSIRSAK
jgi:chromosome segregation ATPase